MNFVKTDKEIKIMKKSGQICAKALRKVLDNVKPQITCKELDTIAEKAIRSLGATPSFMTVDDYKWTICTTINEQVVHGIPNNTTLKEGDILGVDIGALYMGYHSDLAITVPVGKISEETEKFLLTGRKTLEEAIKKARSGNHIQDISETIQNGIQSQGYSIVESLTGHGIGKELHEDPLVPGVGTKGQGPKILKNMTLAIEVIYAAGSGDVGLEEDGWTISTKDKSLAGLFEQTVAITDNGPIVLTPYL